ncbi:MAG: BON domain-containing protein [Candidatus Eremiobacteraeota bacterium]|nr:BON domain-containing protein [Candidatus Eremiobacteraeota bacterium]
MTFRSLGFAFAAALAGCSASQQQSVQSLASGAPQQAHDVVLAASVKAKLAAIDLDSATNVGVRVDDGRALLTGSVKNPAQRAAFESAAKSIGGIRSVEDRTIVNPHAHSAGEQLQDAATATAVSANILAQAGVNAFKVRSTARAGVVTLTGDVPTQALKTTILESARKTPGVKTVVDHLVVK